MTSTEDLTRFRVVHALKIKGVASRDDLADVTGLNDGDLSPVLDELVADGLAKQRTGRVSGYALTPDGRASHPDVLSGHVTPDEVAGVAAAYEAFLSVNGRFKRVCTRWQTRTSSSPSVANAKRPTDTRGPSRTPPFGESPIGWHLV